MRHELEERLAVEQTCDTDASAILTEGDASATLICQVCRYDAAILSQQIDPVRSAGGSWVVDLLERVALVDIRRRRIIRADGVVRRGRGGRRAFAGVENSGGTPVNEEVKLPMILPHDVRVEAGECRGAVHGLELVSSPARIAVVNASLLGHVNEVAILLGRRVPEVHPIAGRDRDDCALSDVLRVDVDWVTVFVTLHPKGANIETSEAAHARPGRQIDAVVGAGGRRGNAHGWGCWGGRVAGVRRRGAGGRRWRRRGRLSNDST